MYKLKMVFLTAAFVMLFACTPSKPVKKGYLKDNISQAELSNTVDYKRYYYICRNFETGSEAYLFTYFPLSRESRLKDNFGFYFQLDGARAEPFDHIENKPLNVRGSRFEVIYRSYHPIQGAEIELIARERSSTYYKNRNGVRLPWLECREV
ncbi:hypothetical protein [Caviibacterium pharyngocola]|uniref:Lipoprotein n=1 Tax=Caviibacterium pharyngocola TaxID=28159 RepID=A0A2M8RU62_9PAST|nr:hypothetical protein [Caviibacterium pharyngocola]PJG82422.1 hypothetical protein CVP04_08775 [Caviibacterium pharyngocola]